MLVQLPGGTYVVYSKLCQHNSPTPPGQNLGQWSGLRFGQKAIDVPMQTGLSPNLPYIKEASSKNSSLLLLYGLKNDWRCILATLQGHSLMNQEPIHLHT